MGAGAGVAGERSPGCFPPPQDGVRYLGGDSTLKGKRPKQNPLVQQGRLNAYAPATFGLHVVIRIAPWDVSRLPWAFRLVNAKESKGSQSENALVRAMRQEVVLPAWWPRPPIPRGPIGRRFQPVRGTVSLPSPVPGS